MPSIATRSCVSVSRSRSVTVRSATLWWSTLLIEHPASDHKRLSGIQPDLQAAVLAGAVDLLLAK